MWSIYMRCHWLNTWILFNVWNKSADPYGQHDLSLALACIIEKYKPLMNWWLNYMRAGCLLRNYQKRLTMWKMKFYIWLGFLFLYCVLITYLREIDQACFDPRQNALRMKNSCYSKIVLVIYFLFASVFQFKIVQYEGHNNLAINS